MKEFYNTYFRIPQDGKISDKVMLVRVGLTAFLMIVCLAAMGLSAYAYFSHNITSGTNMIKAADFDATVEVKIGENIVASENGVYTLEKKAYTVTLTKVGTATTGFCIVEIIAGKNTVKYHTEQLGDGGMDPENAVTFTLDLAWLTGADAVEVAFYPHWGTSCFYGYDSTDDKTNYITENSIIEITIINNADLPGDSEEEESVITDPETTEPVVIEYTIQYGDTLSAIAVRFGVTVKQIVAYNNIADPNVILSGQVIKIPPADWKIPDTVQ